MPLFPRPALSAFIAACALTVVAGLPLVLVGGRARAVPPPTGMNADVHEVPRAPRKPLVDARFVRVPASPEPAADLACTLRTLVERRACLLVGSAPVSGAAVSGARPPRPRHEETAVLVEALCAAVSPAQGTEACRVVAAGQAEVCGAAISSPLVDGEGRFLPAAAACYAALGDAADAARALAEGHQACCACLSEDDIEAAEHQCLLTVAAGRSPPGLDDGHCRTPCAALLLRRPPGGAPSR